MSSRGTALVTTWGARPRRRSASTTWGTRPPPTEETGERIGVARGEEETNSGEGACRDVEGERCRGGNRCRSPRKRGDRLRGQSPAHHPPLHVHQYPHTLGQQPRNSEPLPGQQAAGKPPHPLHHEARSPAPPTGGESSSHNRSTGAAATPVQVAARCPSRPQQKQERGCPA
nr:uncharacterized protein LOC123758387 [Procambarus clarkii]